MLHPCEDMLVLKSSNKDTVPFFNAPIFLENKKQIGKVDEIFGPVKDYVIKKKYIFYLSFNSVIFTMFF
jgi:H/ACA ribonucleoprotein complex subunit 1